MSTKEQIKAIRTLHKYDIGWNNPDERGAVIETLAKRIDTIIVLRNEASEIAGSPHAQPDDFERCTRRVQRLHEDAQEVYTITKAVEALVGLYQFDPREYIRD